jgi:2,3-bisphosphoglycerate-independent phosphoglycerate mutase
MAEALKKAYLNGEDDEALEPRVLVDQDGKAFGRFLNGDYVIFYNLRGEREVELCQSLLDRKFSHFPVERNIHLNMATMIPYHKALPAKVAFYPEEQVRNCLSEVLSRHGLKQVKISESEKAIHVSFFLNGKIREPFPGEERIAVPTPKDVAYFDQKPEMNAAGVADAVIGKLGKKDIAFIFANFANIDVVGHIENIPAIHKAVETVDSQMGLCVEAGRKNKVVTLITADHGTAEKWLYPDGSIDTGHTNNPVPFLVVYPEEKYHQDQLRPGGELSDVAPTVLEILGLPQPKEMTGKSLFVKPPLIRPRRVLLILLDGWGYRDDAYGNLIAQARTPAMDHLRSRCPFTTLKASGEAVGLPEGTVGNSEVGHLHIGVGRKIYSDRLRIDKAIQDGSFFENPVFLWAMRGANQEQKNLHLLGIVSFFSSHGSFDHLIALLKMAQKEKVRNLYLHTMLGRRGEKKESGFRYMEMLEIETRNLGVGKVVSVIGRYWALDREENWNRVQKAYRLLVYGEGKPVLES